MRAGETRTPRQPAPMGRESGFDPEGGAECGALPATATAADADLAEVIAAWPTLPRAVRAGVLAMVRASADA